jgi:hypothetical protein
MISAALGLIGAIALAKAPIESLRSRKALFQVLGLSDTLPKQVLGPARTALVREAEELLEKERQWNKWGAIFLAASFAVLIADSICRLEHEAPSTSEPGVKLDPGHPAERQTQ